MNKKCITCNEIKSLKEFYSKGRKNELSSYCKLCDNTRKRNLQKRFKEQCVEYKGGKCSICSYNKCLGALEFHHLDPTLKDFGIAKIRKASIDESIKKELDKCILLCANCHREIHESI